MELFYVIVAGAAPDRLRRRVREQNQPLLAVLVFAALVSLVWVRGPALVCYNLCSLFSVAEMRGAGV